MTADEQLRVDARLEAETMAADMIEAAPAYREEFMKHLISKLGENFCTSCWTGSPGCQCWNDE